MKFLFLLAMHLFLISCAQPKYEKINRGSNNQKATEQKNSIEFFKSDLSAYVVWQESPVENKKLEMSLRFYNLKNDQPVVASINHELKVFLWMPDMNHGSAPVSLEKISDHEYKIKNIYFIMPGFWQIHFQILNNESLLDEATYDVLL